MILFAVALYSCNEAAEVTPAHVPNVTNDPEVSVLPCTYDSTTYQLLSGQTIDAGELLVTNDKENLYVTYMTSDGWKIDETHLYVGNLEGLPTNNSNTPEPGQFPMKGNHDGLTTVTYTIPLSSLNRDCYIIAAHSSVSKTGNGGSGSSETSWSDGTKFPNTTRWGYYSEYCTQTCEDIIIEDEDTDDTDHTDDTDDDVFIFQG